MIEGGEALTQTLRANLANRKVDDEIDLSGETESVLNSVGASSRESGGRRQSDIAKADHGDFALVAHPMDL